MKFIGIDLGGTKINIGLVSNNKIQKLINEPINSKGTQKEVIFQITSIIDKLFNSEIKGIGIGVPAIVDVKKGVAYESINIFSWKRVPLKEILEKKYKIPVYINNDAKCFALGEKYFGKAKNYQNIVAITIGTGFGSGIIINGELYSGNNCGAGEFGRIVFKEHNLEYYCSGQFFKNKYNITGEELFKRAKHNDSEALKIFEEFGDNIGKALSIIVNSIDPKIIILGGSVSKSKEFFKKSMMVSLEKLIYARVYANLKIEFSNIDDIAVLGAASLCLIFFKKYIIRT